MKDYLFKGTILILVLGALGYMVWSRSHKNDAELRSLPTQAL